MEMSPAHPRPRRSRQVLDSEIGYVNTGRVDPIAFLHGNPMSSLGPEARLPALVRLRQIPVGREPRDATEIDFLVADDPHEIGAAPANFVRSVDTHIASRVLA